VPSVLTSLTKGGIASVTKSLAIEYASRGIRVNAVSPVTDRAPGGMTGWVMIESSLSCGTP
jgi:NAD(P)-dependent dehydrogenase (short-subunit alcohol dehydrogenase family)